MSMRKGREEGRDTARGEGRIIRTTRRALEVVEVVGGEVRVLGQVQVQVEVQVWVWVWVWVVQERGGSSRDGRRMVGGLRVGVELRQGRGHLYEEMHLLIGDDDAIVLAFLLMRLSFCCSTVM